MNNNNKKHFNFYIEYKKTFSLLSVRQQVILLNCLIDYVDSGDLPTKLQKKTMAVFSAIKPIIDGDAEYERIRQERIKAGKKGSIRRWKRNYGTHYIPDEMAKNSKVMAKNSKVMAKNSKN